ncbi:hypothetical protein H0H93_008072 [Arthromyces matolae]|nr:hypothetical protein H0H93_008072 [Arthromyces matolae]
MNSWTTEYMGWLQTANLSLAEKAAPNNHGTFWSNQVAALKILIGDKNGALDVINAYFSEQYMSQITADGEQPLEAARTRPYHYHAYNLAAMITNARLSAYLGDPSVWNKPTTQGSTIKTALDFAMTLNASTSNETNHITNLFPSIAAVGAVYGDPQGLYAGFMQKEVPHYGEEANFLWNQPMAGGEEDSARAAHTLTEIARMPQSTSGPTGRTNVKNSAVRLNGGINWIVGLALLGLLVLGTMGSSC